MADDYSPRCDKCKQRLFYSVYKGTWRCITWNCERRDVEIDGDESEKTEKMIVDKTE